jgi:hypothetical protein
MAADIVDRVNWQMLVDSQQHSPLIVQQLLLGRSQQQQQQQQKQSAVNDLVRGGRPSFPTASNTSRPRSMFLPGSSSSTSGGMENGSALPLHLQQQQQQQQASPASLRRSGSLTGNSRRPRSFISPLDSRPASPAHSESLGVGLAAVTISGANTGDNHHHHHQQQQEDSLAASSDDFYRWSATFFTQPRLRPPTEEYFDDRESFLSREWRRRRNEQVIAQALPSQLLAGRYSFVVYELFYKLK